MGTRMKTRFNSVFKWGNPPAEKKSIADLYNHGTVQGIFVARFGPNTDGDRRVGDYFWHSLYNNSTSLDFIRWFWYLDRNLGEFFCKINHQAELACG